jgi:hypothetical protein
MYFRQFLLHGSFLLFIGLHQAMGQSAPARDSVSTSATQLPTTAEMAHQRAAKTTGRINVFIFSKESHFTLSSFAMRTNTRFAQVFSRKIKVVKITTPDELPGKMKELMDRHPDKMIGNLWIDSHGTYRSGQSLFMLGEDTVNHLTIRIPEVNRALAGVAPYCDEKSFVALGACYGSATYHRPANHIVPERAMNGDSLLLQLGRLFPITPILASESWVMTKPFMFGSKWGVAGYPLEHRFRDELFRPVWDRLGMWRILDAGASAVRPVNTVSLSGKGDIRFNDFNYLDRDKHKRKQEKNISKLQPGLYDRKLLAQ